MGIPEGGVPLLFFSLSEVSEVSLDKVIVESSLKPPLLAPLSEPTPFGTVLLDGFTVVFAFCDLVFFVIDSTEGVREDDSSFLDPIPFDVELYVVCRLVVTAAPRMDMSSSTISSICVSSVTILSGSLLSESLVGGPEAKQSITRTLYHVYTVDVHSYTYTM